MFSSIAYTPFGPVTFGPVFESEGQAWYWLHFGKEVDSLMPQPHTNIQVLTQAACADEISQYVNDLVESEANDF